FRRRREEVQVLPDRPSHRAGNAHEVMQPAQPLCHGRLNQVVVDDDARIRANSVIAEKFDLPAPAPDYQAPKPTVTHQDVSSDPQQKMRDLRLASRLERSSELGRALSLEKQISRSADPEGGHRSERHILPYT